MFMLMLNCVVAVTVANQHLDEPICMVCISEIDGVRVFDLRVRVLVPVTGRHQQQHTSERHCERDLEL